MTELRDAAAIQHRAVLRTAAARGSLRQTSLELVLVWAWVTLLVPLRPASAHPQCLDFEPPFKPPWHLEFCTQYEQFGCCDQKSDNMIAERYWDIIELLETQGLDLCADTLKEMMCQVSLRSYEL